MKEFIELKEEILKRTKKVDASLLVYHKIRNTKDITELINVIKSNFYYVSKNKIIDSALIFQYEKMFNDNNVFCNVDTNTGYLLLTNDATAKIYGNAIAYIYDNATAKIYGNATTHIYDNATVKIYDNATAKIYDNVIAEIYGSATAKIYDNVIAEIYGSATAYIYDNTSAKIYGNATTHIYDNATAKIYDNATAKIYGNNVVELYDNTYAYSYYKKNCTLYGNAIYRIESGNKIICASKNIAFEKQDNELE